MSLINQMLQDLEQRSVGSPVVSGLHGHIRAVPERRRIHPAWWLVLALSLALIGAATWYWTRPAPVLAANPNLSLKIAPDLSTLPSPVAQPPLPLDGASAPAAPAAVGPAEPPTAAPGVPKATAEPQAVRQPASVSENKVSAKDAGKEAAKETIREAPQPLPQQASPEESKPLNLAKQVKPLTPQQQAENEYNKANLLIHAGRSAEAIPGLEQALKLDPRNVTARQTLVGLLLQAKRNDEAMRLAQEGLALDPTQSGLSMILARTQLDSGDVHTALATMEHGLPTAGTRSDYHAFLAALMMREKRNKEAIEQYTIALTSSPQAGVWWMGLGMALQEENHAAEAREAYQRAKATATLTPELQAYVEQRLVQLSK